MSEQPGPRLFLGERVVFWPRRRYVIVCECGWSADVRRRGKAVRLGNRHRAAHHPPRQGLMRFARTKGEAA